MTLALVHTCEVNVKREPSTLKVGNHASGSSTPCLIVAEVAQGHDGSLGLAHTFIDAVAKAGIEVADNERLSLHSLRHTYTSHLIVGLELDAVTTSQLAGHANPNVTMRVYADDFRKAAERNAAVLARAAERGFGT